MCVLPFAVVDMRVSLSVGIYSMGNMYTIDQQRMTSESIPFLSDGSNQIQNQTLNKDRLCFVMRSAAENVAPHSLQRQQCMRNTHHIGMPCVIHALNSLP